MYSIPYHGNWCGPGWSDGRRTSSVRGFAPAIDEFDETCRQHDFALSGGRSDLDADLVFFNSNFGKGTKRTLAAVAVAGRALVDRVTTGNKPNKFEKRSDTMKKTTPPGKKNPKPTMRPQAIVARPKPNPTPVGMQTVMSTPPVSYGTSIRAKAPKVERSLTKARMQGRDFIGTVEGQGVATFGLGKSALLSPAYFLSTVLGNLSRSFERYRWNKLRIHYVPKVATSVTGQLIMCSQRSVSEPGLQPESGTFLPRSMSQGNATFGPLWTPAYIDIDCDSTFRNVDPATTADIDDCIHEELQVYTQVNSSQQVGYLFAEYDISFEEPVFQPHSTLIPIPTGPGVRAVLVDTGAVAVDDDIAFNDPQGTLGLTNLSNGTVFRMVFDLQGSTAPTGTTFSNVAKVATVLRTTNTSTLTNVTSNLLFVGGLTLYGVVIGSQLDVYASLESAITGSGSGQVFARTLSTAAGSYQFDCAIVRYAPSVLASIQ